MSEPMTSFEIEDVLSSIRRLVSEDSVAQRPRSRPRPLLLTPALRVSPPVAQVPVPDQAVGRPQSGAETTVAEAAETEDREPADEDFGICDTVNAVEYHAFAGRFARSPQLRIRAVMGLLGAVPGDHRNWDEVAQWAADISRVVRARTPD